MVRIAFQICRKIVQCCHAMGPRARTDPLKRCQRSRRRSSSRKPRCPTTPKNESPSNATVEISRNLSKSVQICPACHVAHWKRLSESHQKNAFIFGSLTANKSISDIHSILSMSIDIHPLAYLAQIHGCAPQRDCTPPAEET